MRPARLRQTGQVECELKGKKTDPGTKTDLVTGHLFGKPLTAFQFVEVHMISHVAL